VTKGPGENGVVATATAAPLAVSGCGCTKRLHQAVGVEVWVPLGTAVGVG